MFNIENIDTSNQITTYVDSNNIVIINTQNINLLRKSLFGLRYIIITCVIIIVNASNAVTLSPKVIIDKTDIEN